MRLLAAMILLAASAQLAATEQDVSDLLFSEIMFYRLQDNNFDAISHYLDARDKKTIDLNKNNMAYIASVYLNYDLHSQVTSMLDLLIKNSSSAIRDKSWFYLGKLHYEGRRVDSAVEAFSKIEGKLSVADQEMKYIMHGIMAMNNQRYETAIKEFSKVSLTSVYAAYVKYNLAVCKMKQSNDLAAFEMSLTGLANQQASASHSSVFSDQVYTTLGYVLLQKGYYQQSKVAFRKVSAGGHLASRALQGMIYASSELRQYEIALNLSLRLIKLTIGNEAVHHAYIVIPYLLQKLNNTEKALAFYQHAVEYFDQQRLDLNRYIKKTRAGEFDQYLLELDKILHVHEWIEDREMSRLFRFVSTLDEWRDAVYKFKEMQFIEKRLDDVFYELVVAEPDIVSHKITEYKQVLADIEQSKSQVKESIVWHQEFARHFVINTLQSQYDDVTDYLSQARFALAQFYDSQEQKQKQREIDGLLQQQGAADRENNAYGKTAR